MVEQDLQQAQAEKELGSQYQTSLMHFGPFKEDKIYSFQKENLKNGLELYSENYKEISFLYDQEYLSTRDKYGKKNVLQSLVRLISIQLCIEETLIAPIIRVALEGGIELEEQSMSGIRDIKRHLETLWNMVGTSEDITQMDESLKQVIQQLNQHGNKMQNDVFPLLCQKLNAFQLNTLYSLMHDAKEQAKDYPLSNLNWITGHRVNEFIKFVENLQHELGLPQKGTYLAKHGYHK